MLPDLNLQLQINTELFGDLRADKIDQPQHIV